MIEVNKPRFSLGQVVATPGCLAAFEEAGQQPWEFLARHVRGDWGDVDEQDQEANDLALQDGSRILSAYTLSSETRIWIITEATDDAGQRSATTCLLPEEY